MQPQTKNMSQSLEKARASLWAYLGFSLSMAFVLVVWLLPAFRTEGDWWLDVKAHGPLVLVVGVLAWTILSGLVSAYRIGRLLPGLERQRDQMERERAEPQFDSLTGLAHRSVVASAAPRLFEDAKEKGAIVGIVWNDAMHKGKHAGRNFVV